MITLALACAVSLGWSDEPFVTVLTGARVVGTGDASLEGTLAEVRIVDGVIEAVGPEVDLSSAQVVDVRGKWLAPAFVDSHVHLALHGGIRELQRNGVVGHVDLGAPLARVSELWIPWQHVRFAGPMLTAVDGYPLGGWGKDGYGLAVKTPDDARRAVARLAEHKVDILKIPFGIAPELDDETITAAVAEAKRRGMRVVAHALSDRAAERAARLGAEVLAHIPTAALSDETIKAWSKRVVIPTLAAFGGSPVAIENLRRLRAAGAKVLYGTDLGNTQDARIQADELALMARAGMDGAAIVTAGTSAPAMFWGFDAIGQIAPKKMASLLVLDADPRVDPSVLSRPRGVYIQGYDSSARASK